MVSEVLGFCPKVTVQATGSHRDVISCVQFVALISKNIVLSVLLSLF